MLLRILSEGSTLSRCSVGINSHVFLMQSVTKNNVTTSLFNNSWFAQNLTKFTLSSNINNALFELLKYNK